jgi:cyanophycin synthetase
MGCDRSIERGQPWPDEHLDSPGPERSDQRRDRPGPQRAGLEALLEIMSGIRPPYGRLLLGVGTAGDRGNDVFVRLGEIAALGADVVEIVHKGDYLRGRSMAEINELITEGAGHAGMSIQRAHESELGGLVSLVDQARSDDVVAIMTHQDREELDRWLLDHQATPDDAAALRAKVQRAGERL